MAFDLEDQPRTRFEKNPLKTVVCQLRFPQILKIDQGAFVADFQEAIRDDYPAADPRGRTISVGPSDEGIAAGPVEPAPWQFQDESRDWVVALTRDYVSLETSTYRQFEDFISRFERILEAAEQTFGLRHFTRLGLRYVDQIKHEDAASPLDFRSLLNPELLGIVAGEKIAPYVVDAIQQVHLDIEGTSSLVIRHGFVGHQRHEEGPFYLIDTDAFRLEPSPQPYDRAECISRAWEFKRHCWNFFRWSISKELFEYLGPKQPLESGVSV